MFRNPPSRLEPGAFFSRDERRRLAHLAAEYSPRELLDNPRILEDRSIEYAFLTSRLEGSTYSRKSAAILLKYGITDEKPLSDALMLCDIWKTFQYVISTAQVQNVLTKDFLCELHAIALGNHQLSEKQQGTVHQERKAIGGGARSREQLETELEHCLSAARRIDDPFEKAAGIHCGLLRLRYFTAGNRRTARLMETAVLVNHGITPLFIEESDMSSYPDAVLSCCEREASANTRNSSSAPSSERSTASSIAGRPLKPPAGKTENASAGTAAENDRAENACRLERDLRVLLCPASTHGLISGSNIPWKRKITKTIMHRSIFRS